MEAGWRFKAKLIFLVPLGPSNAKIEPCENKARGQSARLRLTLPLIMNTELLQLAANQARGLAMDAVHKANSGHLGLPLGCAEIGATLWGGGLLQCDPADPKWLNRDRFVLSAGHGSMFLYSWLCIAGYEVSTDDLAGFRQLHSITPGHPEFRETPGVEATTGPLGQGTGNSVGYAISAKRAMEKFNTARAQILDYHVICLAGDGCLQEGVGLESVTLAGHLGLDNLILIYDANGVTLDAMAEITQSGDVEKKFESIGWDVQIVEEGHDFGALATALNQAKSNDDGRPKLIVAKTEIGRGIVEIAGSQKAHGEGGVKFIDAARELLGLPADEDFYISPEVRDYFGEMKVKHAEQHAQWQKQYEAWGEDNPQTQSRVGDQFERRDSGRFVGVDPRILLAKRRKPRRATRAAKSCRSSPRKFRRS